HFAIHPSGRWLLAANQDTDSIVVFSRAPATGGLAPAGHSAALSMPVCLVWGRSGGQS
ncbi:MAG: lactonase family protein, partial [Planctomycetes bacterium]|nr:lactonase family protein [Planctomycetota bacterium]